MVNKIFLFNFFHLFFVLFFNLRNARRERTRMRRSWYEKRSINLSGSWSVSLSRWCGFNLSTLQQECVWAYDKPTFKYSIVSIWICFLSFVCTYIFYQTHKYFIDVCNVFCFLRKIFCLSPVLKKNFLALKIVKCVCVLRERKVTKYQKKSQKDLWMNTG